MSPDTITGTLLSLFMDKFTETLKYPNKSHPKFTLSDHKRIIEKYQSSMTAQQVADEVGVGKKTILLILKRYGVTRTAAESKTIKLPRKKVIKMYVEQKMSATAIGKKFGTEAHTILKRLREWDIPIVKNRQPKLIKIDDIPQMITDYENGVSSEKLAEQLDISPSKVLRTLKEHDVEVKPGGCYKTKELPADSIIKLYSYGYSADYIAQQYDCSLSHVLNCLHNCGIETVYNGRTPAIMSAAGYKVRSSLELVVADWLEEHHIPHEYDTRIPHSRKRCDFKVGSLYIEVCGIQNDLWNYDVKLNLKIDHYEKHDLNYVLLSPTDVNSETLNKIIYGDDLDGSTRKSRTKQSKLV
jgi:hypothetical protein